MPDERPTWAVDALDNPADDEFDDLEAFDPENGRAESGAVALSRGESKVSPEDQALSDAQRLVKAYKAGRQVLDGVDVQPYALPEVKSTKFEPSDIAQFLFGDEMASIGMSLDEGDVRWKMETAVQQWSEHPIRTSLAWAGWALPGIGKLAKMRRAKILDGITDTDLIKSGKFESVEALGATDEHTKLLAKQQLYHDNKYQDLLAKREHAPEEMGLHEKTHLWFLENFGHAYSRLADPSSSIVHNMTQKAYMNRVLQEEVVDPFLKEIPDSLMNTDDLGKYLLGKKNIGDFDDAARPWVSAFEADLKAEQAYAREIGMITDETHEKIGDLWIPLIRKDMGRVQRGKEDTLTLLRGRRPIEIRTARLESDAFKERMTGLDEFGDMMDAGETFGDPKTLTMQGLMEQKMLIMNHEYIRDIAMNPTFAKTASEVKEAGLDARKWISLDEIPGNHRIRRMIGKVDPSQADKDINIRIDMFEGIFGKNGMVNASRESLKAFESLVAVHKTVKCITGDMRILTSEGYVKIKDAYEYKEGYLTVSEGDDYLLTPNGWERPLQTYKESNVPTLKVTLRDGTIIKGTSEHPLFSRKEKVTLGDLCINDVIDTYYGGEFPKEKVKIAWNSWKGQPEGNEFIQIDEDMAELIGWILGDGSVHRAGNSWHTKITVGYKDFDWTVARLSQLCDRLGLNYTVWREKETRENANGVLSYFNIFNANFGRFLAHIGVIVNNKKSLTIPEEVFRSPKSVVAGFIRGLFDTDGSVTKSGECAFSSISEALSREVHLVLKWLGIASSIEKRIEDRTIKSRGVEKVYKNHESWRIRFASRAAKQVVKELQLFGMPNKMRRIENSLLGARGCNRTWVNRVVSIEKGETETVYDVCLKNDPHVFITEGLPNHNTALNPFTHGQNLMGNVVFLSQAGFRMFTGKEAPQNWKAIVGSMRNVNEHYKYVTGKLDVDARSLKAITVGGRKFSPDEIAAELESPWVVDIIEQGQFLAAEGTNGAAVMKMADAAADLNDYLGRATKAAAKTMDSSIRMYNIEDAGPKFAYYLHNRAKGLTQQAAATEVARRLPIYHGTAAGPRFPIVGGLGPGSLKKWALPWISFPAEAARITKNNLIDSPLRMAAWLHAPQMMQSTVYAGSHALGIGEQMTYEDYGGIRRGLPIYGQKPSAVVLPMRDKNNDFRAAMLDFIPHFSFYPATEAPEASFREANPQDIAPILSGFMDIIKGEGPFGRPIQPTSKADLAGKFVANAIGFVTPPYVQKYFFNITSPREQPFGVNTYRLEQDMGKMVNPSTGKPGSWLGDLLINNTVMRNYASSPEQELFNKQLDKDRTVEKVRGEFTRRFNANARSGNIKGAANELVNVMHTFNKEYTPGATSQLKYSEWLVRHARQLHRHPQLRRYSLEDLQRLLIQNIEQINKARNVGLERTIAAVKREFIARQMR
ncbi:MAG: LAGLIDADG family homing endonuclease [Nitrososphaerales archaeon]